MAARTGPKISYGFRGEGISYESEGKNVEIDFTYHNGNRIYTDSISRWNDRTIISDAEKKTILRDLLRFTKGWFRKSIVVINTDDPSQSLWEDVCTEMAAMVKGIEYTSDEINRQFERQMYLGTLNSKGGLIINGVSIDTEEKLDEVLAAIQKEREARASKL